MKKSIEELLLDKEVCFSKTRGISDAMYVLHGKWKFPLLFTLRQNPMRFNEILAALEGLSSKVLAKELRELELNGLVARKVLSVKPAAIIYEATPYSDTLHDVLFGLSEWGEHHKEKVKEGLRDT